MPVLNTVAASMVVLYSKAETIGELSLRGLLCFCPECFDNICVDSRPCGDSRLHSSAAERASPTKSANESENREVRESRKDEQGERVREGEEGVWHLRWRHIHPRLLEQAIS